MKKRRFSENVYDDSQAFAKLMKIIESKFDLFLIF